MLYLDRLRRFASLSGRGRLSLTLHVTEVVCAFDFVILPDDISVQFTARIHSLVHTAYTSRLPDHTYSSSS